MYPSAIGLRASRMVLAAACIGFLLFMTSSAFGQYVTRVEEDWELVIAEPEPNCVSPQITTTMSPTDNLLCHYTVFEMNQQTLNTFIPGGMQLQAWDGPFPLGERSIGGNTVLRTAGETIRWTQRMQLDNWVLSFEIRDGSSTTWGDFGGDEGHLRYSVWAFVDDLNGYSPAVAVPNCGIGYASNRVTSLVLKRVRYTLSTGQTVEDNVERTVYPQP